MFENATPSSDRHIALPGSFNVILPRTHRWRGHNPRKISRIRRRVQPGWPPSQMLVGAGVIYFFAPVPPPRRRTGER